jgi:GntR family transcriptional repressor for pyruvate dehydrogenase complex
LFHNDPLDRSRLTDRVAAHLRSLIVKGVYPPGSRLPTGQELAAELGVTRLTVREALATLEATGLTRTRHGSGTYVVDPAQHATLQVLAAALSAGRDMTPGEVSALLDFREVVILGFIDAIHANVRDVHLERLDAILKEERAALGQPVELARTDYRFNEVLAEASGNLFYTLLLRSVADAHIHLGEIVFRHSGDGAIVVDTHESIVRALRKGDAAQLRKRIRTYLDGGKFIVAEWIRTKG